MILLSQDKTTIIDVTGKVIGIHINDYVNIVVYDGNSSYVVGRYESEKLAKYELSVINLAWRMTRGAYQSTYDMRSNEEVKAAFEKEQQRMAIKEQQRKSR